MRERTSGVEVLRHARSGSAVPRPGIVFDIVKHLVEASGMQRIDGTGRIFVRKRGIQPLRQGPVVFAAGLQNGPRRHADPPPPVQRGSGGQGSA